MTAKDKKQKVTDAVKAQGWEVERIDLRRGVARISSSGKVGFVTLWRGMSEQMIINEVALTIRTA